MQARHIALLDTYDTTSEPPHPVTVPFRKQNAKRASEPVETMRLDIKTASCFIMSRAWNQQQTTDSANTMISVYFVIRKAIPLVQIEIRKKDCVFHSGSLLPAAQCISTFISAPCAMLQSMPLQNAQQQENVKKETATRPLPGEGRIHATKQVRIEQGWCFTSSIFGLHAAQNFFQHTFKEPFNAIAHAHRRDAVPVVDIFHQATHLRDQSADLLINESCDGPGTEDEDEEEGLLLDELLCMESKDCCVFS
ncbi:hypothetical protein KCU90_g245, partial [Aureobasidium melanogenum]